MICPNCQHEVPENADYCPRCQKRLAAPFSEPAASARNHDKRTMQSAADSSPALGSVGDKRRLTILGYREWYAVNWKIAVRVDGALVGTIGPNERLDLTLDKDVVDVTVAYISLGKERRPKTSLVRLDDRTCLQIKTSRWSGAV